MGERGNRGLNEQIWTRRKAGMDRDFATSSTVGPASCGSRFSDLPLLFRVFGMNATGSLHSLLTGSAVFVVALVLLLPSHAESAAKLLNKQPEWLKKPCKRKDPRLNECIRDTFQNMFPYMAKGIPEVAIPRFEPLFIEKIGITKGHGAVTLAGNFHNLYAHGPSNTSAEYTRFDIESGRFDIGLAIPTITTESQYDLRGNILLLPIVGKGDAKLLLRNVTTEVFMKVSFPVIQGEEVMHVDHMRVDFRMASCRVHLENLFNGNKVLGHTVNSFLNKNALEVVDELKENIGESLAVVFKKVMNDAFGRVPTKFWIPREAN